MPLLIRRAVGPRFEFIVEKKGRKKFKKKTKKKTKRGGLEGKGREKDEVEEEEDEKKEQKVLICGRRCHHRTDIPRRFINDPRLHMFRHLFRFVVPKKKTQKKTTKTWCYSKYSFFFL